jgi:omega-6 fatty acid desaturase (delta-12 desaturase)
LSVGHHLGRSTTDPRTLRETLNGYGEPCHVRSTVELAITVLPLMALWTAAWFTFWLGQWWASLLIAVPAAGFLVRLFIIQHDCGHGAFFSDGVRTTGPVASLV